ncbi:MAG: response regulator transcription factor [Cyanobacteria bacterium P01_G01_bin.38]
MCQILIIEDEENLAAFMVKGFRKYGFTPTVVSDGEQALQATQESVYDVILLDIGLPVKNGWDVLRELRARGDERPVIVVTAVSDLRKQALAAGANDYVPKPFRFMDLLAVVRRQLGEE